MGDIDARRSLRVRKPAPPTAMPSASALVGRRRFTAVTALPLAMSKLPSCVLSSLCSRTMLALESTITITTGQLFYLASASASVAAAAAIFVA